MNNAINNIISLISTLRLNMTVEKQTQQQIATAFTNNAIIFKREFYLDEKNIPDFFIEPGIAIEVKIKGQRTAIYKQLKRYCEFDQVKTIILISGRSMGLPGLINGKPCYYVNITRAYL